MAYTPIQTSAARNLKSTNSTGAVKGINIFTAPEFLSTDFAQNIENMTIQQEGQLEKIKGKSLVSN